MPQFDIEAVVDIKTYELLGFQNVYDDGDRWDKIRGCRDCPPQKRCCGNCPLSSDYGCYLHVVNKGQDKPLHCVIHPIPTKHRPNCCLEYRCVRGKYIGFVRKQCEPSNILIDEETCEKVIV